MRRVLFCLVLTSLLVVFEKWGSCAAFGEHGDVAEARPRPEKPPAPAQ